MNRRTRYLVTILLTIVIGIAARKISAYFPEWINFWLGDALYAFMMFFLVAFLIVNKPAIVKAVIALIICYCIELSQLWQGEWINSVRQTVLGKLVLGNGFLWSDLVAYLAGIIAAYCVETLRFQRYKTSL
jgi:hypothetical protein